jgi:hypothetical protein
MTSDMTTKETENVVKLYKVLAEDGSAFHGGNGRWPLPNGNPGEWLAVSGELEPCRHGLHLCRRSDLIHWLGPVIYLAEHEGEKIIAKDKIVVRKARLLSRLDTWNETTARLFAADCAERALKNERKAGREPDERSWEAVRVARLYARGEVDDAARAATWAAARDAARDAASTAAGDAARAAWAAGAAAWAAGAAAWAAGAAAWAAASTAAWDAALDAAGAHDRAAERKWQTHRLFEYLDGVRT